MLEAQRTPRMIAYALIIGGGLGNLCDRVLRGAVIDFIDLYWGKYHLNLPDKTNDGAIRGSICHLVFELLLQNKHKKHYDEVVNSGDLETSPALIRLVKKHLRKQNAFHEENYDMIKDMVLVGLKFDFYCEGSDLGDPELRFEIYNENPEYRIMGFIDKYAIYDEEEKTVKIIDYKSSKYWNFKFI